MSRNIILAAVVIIIIVAAVAGYLYFSGHQSTSTQVSSMSQIPTTSKGLLVISIADAYKGEADSLGMAFQNATGVPYTVYSGGSFAVAREIASGIDNTTVFLSIADSAYYPSYMGNDSPGWAIGLVTDQLVIAYSNQSLSNPEAATIIKLFKEAEATNSSKLFYYAFGNLTSGQVKVGISNPLTDPAGFRAWLALEIAGYLYADNESYFADRMLANQGNITASNAAELVPSLETGQIQFLFIYKSAALAKGLGYIPLPAQMNFGNVSYASFYSKFTYVAGGKTFRGGPIILWISVPKNTNNEALAFQFVNFTLNHLNILASYGLSPLSKPVLEVWVPQNQLPPFVQTLIKDNEVQVVTVNPS